MDKVSKSLSRALGGESAFQRKRRTSQSSEVRDHFYTLNEDDCVDITADNEDLKWRYKEAAIYMTEGKSGANFKHHPTTPKAIRAYQLVHHPIVRLVDLLACIVILCMAFVERPSVTEALNDNRARKYVSGSIELVCYLYLIFVAWITIRWLGWRNFLRRKSSFMYVIMFVAVIDVILMMALPFHIYRFSRPFRPIYIINNHYSAGTRTVIIDIIKSAREIIDVFLMTITFVFVFALLGFFLFFDPTPGRYIQLDQNWYFRSLGYGFVSFFICLTTANFPDVMLPAYKTIGHSATIYFIVFCTIGIYFLQNLFLAAIYSSFNENSKIQFRKLLLSSRMGLRSAFNLVDTDRTKQMTYKQFRALIKYYAPIRSVRDVTLTFKLLDEDAVGFITLDQFYDFPSTFNIAWETSKVQDQFFIFSYQKLPEFIKPVARGMYWFVTWVYFQWIVNFVIIANTIWLLIKAIIADGMVNTEGGSKAVQYLNVPLPIDYIFIGFYVIEVLVRIIGLGWNKFVNSIGNIVDFVIILAALIGGILSSASIGDPLSYLAFLRLFLILRFIDFRLKLTVAMETIGMILPRMVSFILVVTYMFYFFGVIGMEAFAFKNSRCGCTMVHHYSTVSLNPLNQRYNITPTGPTVWGCNDNQFYNVAGNTTVFFENVNGTLEICRTKTTAECVQDNGLDCDCTIKSCGSHYSGSYDRTSQDGLYYLMNFDNIVNSYITLFALMVVNNWQVIMFGTVDAVGNTWCVAFFIFFYFIAVEVVVNVVQAFILDAFNKMTPHVQSHLEQRDAGKSSRDVELITVLVSSEERKLMKNSQRQVWYAPYSAGYIQDDANDEALYAGRRKLNRFDIFLIVYEDDLPNWVEEEEGENSEKGNEPILSFRPGQSSSTTPIASTGDGIELTHVTPSEREEGNRRSEETDVLKAHIKRLEKELEMYKSGRPERPRSTASNFSRNVEDTVPSVDTISRGSGEPSQHPRPPPRGQSQQSHHGRPTHPGHLVHHGPQNQNQDNVVEDLV